MWEHTSGRAVLHCIMPTKSAVSIAKIEPSEQEIIVDMKIEVTVLADYKNYPDTGYPDIGYRDDYAQPLEVDELFSSRPLELFRSTVGLLANPSVNASILTGKTYPKYKQAAAKAALEAQHFRRALNTNHPYMTIDDILQGARIAGRLRRGWRLLSMPDVSKLCLLRRRMAQKWI
jgi:hypothetical protein